MNTQKIAVTMSTELLSAIDLLSRQKGISRSRFISDLLYEKISEKKTQALKNAYDSVFSEESICKEQLETAKWFEGIENKEGETW